MIIKAKHPDTGADISLDVPVLNEQDLNSLAEEQAPRDRILRMLENLDLNAETKLFLSKLLDYSITVGGVLVRLGKKILEIALFVASRLPLLTFWTVLAAVFAFLMSQIPVLGAVLGAFLSPVLIFAGLVKGFYEELASNNPTLNDLLQSASESFKPLSKQA